jgi:hypothetical protein
MIPHMGVLKKVVLWSGVSAAIGFFSMFFVGGFGPCGPTSDIGLVMLFIFFLGLGVFLLSLPTWGIWALVREGRRKATPAPSTASEQ